MINYIQGKENLEDLPEFDDHRLITFLYDTESDLRGYIAIHRGGITRPAFGATRLWHYNSGVEAFRDALKLSKMMSYKAAMAGLRYGGGKGVIIRRPSSLKNRNLLLKSYAQKVNYLGGNFITGTDVGLNKRDLKLMLKETSFMIGAAGNPEEFTVLDLAKKVKRATGSTASIKIEAQALPQDDPERRRPDITRAKKLLNWQPKIKFSQGLEKTIAYFREKLEHEPE